MAKCRADGYKVTVLVVDGLNAPKAMLRDDGASASTTEAAKMKATSTMLYNRPSGPGPAASTRHHGSTRDDSRHDQFPGRRPDQIWRRHDRRRGGQRRSRWRQGCRVRNAALAKVADKLK